MQAGSSDTGRKFAARWGELIFVVYPNERVMNVGDLMAWDMAPLIDDAVHRAVSAIPIPKDGEPGKDGAAVTEAMVRTIVAV